MDRLFAVCKGLGWLFVTELFQHKLVPWHEIVPAEEKELILKKYGLAADRMPQVLESDAVVQALGAKHGDLIRIIRKSHTAGSSVYYRIVD